MTQNKVAVVCFLWGSWPIDRPELGREYVRKLKSSVLRNSETPFDWYEFGDFGTPLPKMFKGLRWNLKKMFMYSSESGLSDYEWVVALDLDMVISGNVDFLFQHRSRDLVTCCGAYNNGDPGGSIIGFDPSQLWTQALSSYLRYHKEGIESITRGSERKFYKLLSNIDNFLRIQYWQNLFPGKIVSYKVDGYLPEASIIRFHGKPRPHQVDERWIKENWR